MSTAYDLLLPLYEGALVDGDFTQAPNYLGMAFFIHENGSIATCSHVIQAAKDSNNIVGIMMGTHEIVTLNNIQCHETYDFAIARSSATNVICLPLVTDQEFVPGRDVMAMGITNDGIKDGITQSCCRLKKGYIVRTHGETTLKHMRYLHEISFPSLSGYSGTPLLMGAPASHIIGILHSNNESTIELDNFSEINNKGQEFSQEIHRIVEYGLVHSPADIRQFLLDLKFES